MRTTLAAIGLLVAAAAGFGWLPIALERGYGELPLIALPLTGWFAYLGRKYGRPGPAWRPASAAPHAVLAVATTALAASPASWASALALGPAAYLLAVERAPTWATPRLLLGSFFAPLSLALDAGFGDALRVATAAGASGLAGVWDQALSTRIHDQLVCGPHIIEVTPQCSGARLAERMLALAAIIAALRPMAARATLTLLAASTILAAATNVARIAALCAAAPAYEVEALSDLERYHDLSGLVAFVLAYFALAALAERLRRGDPP